jgi:hypothetical protein
MFICIKLLPWYYCDVEETELPSEKMQRSGCRNIYTQLSATNKILKRALWI